MNHVFRQRYNHIEKDKTSRDMMHNDYIEEAEKMQTIMVCIDDLEKYNIKDCYLKQRPCAM